LEGGPARLIGTSTYTTARGEKVWCLLLVFSAFSFFAILDSVRDCPWTGDDVLAAPTPRCSDMCYMTGLIVGHIIGSDSSEERIGNGVCEDGGRDAASSHCNLGSDMTDCGCRNGTIIADWLNTSQLERDPYERSWGERGELGQCHAASRGPFYAGLATGAIAVLMCLELRQTWDLVPPEGVPPRARWDQP
jgi:hypothetical protein